MDLKKMIWASLLATISIIIDVFFKSSIPVLSFGTPYYAIPIVIASIFLGLKYSLIVAISSDFLGVIISGMPFFPLFTIAPIIWALISSLTLSHKSEIKKILFVIIIIHILASIFNSLALMVHVHKNIKGVIVDLPIRLLLIIPNSIILSCVIKSLLIPIEERLSIKLKKGEK